MSHTVTFDFDELVIPILGKNDSGLLIYGNAELVENYAGSPDEGFYVKSIVLHDGAELTPTGRGFLGLPNAFEAELFKRMAAVIENENTAIGRHAAIEWKDSIERMKEAA
jgi:hypothetical protein